MSSIQNRIDHIDTQISALDAEIAQIDAATTSDSTIQNCLDQRRNRLNRRRSQLTNHKNHLENVMSNDFSSEQQTVVDEINTLFEDKYSSNMEELRKSNDTRKTSFFDMYSAADTDFLRELIIQEFFNIIS